jgi:hypothetical protein
MWIDLLPTVFILIFVAWFIVQHRGAPVLQIYALIVTCYLNLFPALDYLFSNGEGMANFVYFQVLIFGFFQLPLLYIAHASFRGLGLLSVQVVHAPVLLSGYLPIILGILLLAFWFVAIQYDLFFRRLGHETLAMNSASVPGALLYLYRCVVETSFFVIIFLWTTLRCASEDSPFYRGYQMTLAGYIFTFGLFFAANSRMQFVLLILCLICTQPSVADFLFRRVMRFGLTMLLLVFGLTLFRELFLEANGRLDLESLYGLLLDTGGLIAARLNSVVVLYQLQEAGFDPFGFQISGILHVLNFYGSFVFNPADYEEIKATLVTSPSVEIINRLMSSTEVDFPKSMIMDMFLSFGVLGLLLTATILGTSLGRLQRQLLLFNGFTPAFLISLYALPLLLAFEKEFLGMIFSFIKWLPILLLLYLLSPRFINRSNDGIVAIVEVVPPVGTSGKS